MKSDQRELVSDGSMTIVEAGKFTGLGRSTIYGLMDDGSLDYVKVGRRRLIPRRSLTDMLQRALVSREAVAGA
jgi:excisionase family DNA binding protein